MIRKVKIILISLTVIILSYCAFSFAIHHHAQICSKNESSFRFCGNDYMLFDEQNDNQTFLPFGAYNCFYRDQIKFSSFLGFRFQKNSEKRFVFEQTLLGVTAYKRTDYIIPTDPKIDEVDCIIVFNRKRDTEAEITTKQDIIEVVEYFNSKRDDVYSIGESDIVLYAVSVVNEGLFELTGAGRSIVLNNEDRICFETMSGKNELPESIQRIILNV